jgi:hypothetical protein
MLNAVKFRAVIVGTRHGKRAIRWPGLLGTIAFHLVVFTLVMRALDWLWAVVFRDWASQGWGSAVGFAVWMTIVFLAIELRRAWLTPVEKLPVLDRPA